jgi:hypothetical protein
VREHARGRSAHARATAHPTHRRHNTSVRRAADQEDRIVGSAGSSGEQRNAFVVAPASAGLRQREASAGVVPGSKASSAKPARARKPAGSPDHAEGVGVRLAASERRRSRSEALVVHVLQRGHRRVEREAVPTTGSSPISVADS